MRAIVAGLADDAAVAAGMEDQQLVPGAAVRRRRRTARMDGVQKREGVEHGVTSRDDALEVMLVGKGIV